MRFIRKFLIIFISIFISFISQVNYGICSDNVSGSAQVAQSLTIPTQTQQQNLIAPTPVQSSGQQIQQHQPYLPPVNLQENQQKNQGFIPTFMNMLKALINVIILIMAIAGIIVLYRRLKSRAPVARKSKKEATSEHATDEPTNVSEAVSSFVRHKIKRSS